MINDVRYEETFFAARPMKVVAWSVLSFCLVSFVLTGSFVPLVDIESLNSSHNVTRVLNNGIELDDGRTVYFRQLQYFPTNAVVLAALSKGVEIANDGTVYGLLRFYYFPGRTPYVYVRKRLNVVSLAIATDPDCLRPELTKRDEWERLYQVLVDKRSLRKLKNGCWRVGYEAWVDAVTKYLAKERSFLIK